jgi:biotin carboxyl carrier protein
MKMENVVQAPPNGTVRKVFVAAGDTVAEGDPLVEMQRPEMTTL